MNEVANVPLMVVSDSLSITELVEKNLFGECAALHIAYDPENWVQTLQHSGARIILLAFEHIDLAVKCRNLLVNSGGTADRCQYLTLCDKKEVQRAYDLCCQQIFNNYIVFWPLSFDPPRLRMAIRQAAQLIGPDSTAPESSPVKAVEDTRLTAFNELLNQHLDGSQVRLDEMQRLVQRAESDFHSAIDQTYQQLLQDAGTNTGMPGHQPDRLVLQDRFQLLAQGLQNLRDWSMEFAQVTERHRELAARLAPASQRTQTILVVDDDDFQRNVVRQLLKDEPYQLEFAHNGEEALDKLRRQVPDLILMDVMMPGVDGIEATRRISTHPQYQHIPIVMITSYSERDVVVDCLKAGAIDFVVKPYNRKILLAKISSVLRNPTSS